MTGLVSGLFRNDRWIPASFVGFFVFLTCVEALLITLAVNSFTGLSESDPYRRGLDYNTTLEERRKDHDLGWRVAVGYEPEGKLQGRVRVAARDATGAELSGVRISGTAEHPGKDPIAIDFTPLNDGSAEGELKVAAPGRWFLRIHIAGGDASIERKREIFIEPR